MPYRPITEQEISAVADIQARAFRLEPSRYEQSYRQGGRFDWQAVRAWTDERGDLVAALIFFERAMSLNGGALNAGLVAGVGVPPEQRRRGHARALMGGLLAEMHERQLPLSLLYPFSTAFYRSLGYGLVNFNWHLDIPPRFLPDYPERLAVRRAVREQDAPAIRDCYDRARQQPVTNGWFARTDWEWANRFWRDNQEVVVSEVAGQVEGYLVYTLTVNWEQGTTTAKVIEWVSATDAAWRGIVGFLAALVEQATVLVYNAPRETPLLHILHEPYSHIGGTAEFVYRQAARLTSGLMGRVVHLPTALRERVYPIDLRADLILRVADGQLPDNSAPLRLQVAKGRASVAPAPVGAASAAIESDIATFSQLYLGFLTAEAARTAGRLRADDEQCASLTAAFAAAPLFLHQNDWF